VFVYEHPKKTIGEGGKTKRSENVLTGGTGALNPKRGEFLKRQSQSLLPLGVTLRTPVETEERGRYDGSYVQKSEQKGSSGSIDKKRVGGKNIPLPHGRKSPSLFSGVPKEEKSETEKTEGPSLTQPQWGQRKKAEIRREKKRGGFPYKKTRGEEIFGQGEHHPLDPPE